MFEIKLTEKDLSQAQEVRKLMDSLLTEEHYQQSLENDWFQRDRLETILIEKKIPQKYPMFQAESMNYPLSLAFPDWKTIFSNSLAQEDSIKLHKELIQHMQELEQFKPMHLISLALKEELLSYMQKKDQEIEEASDLMYSQSTSKIRAQELPQSAQEQELELAAVEIQHQLMETYVHLPEALTEDLEERTLITIQQLCIIEHREKDYPQIMEFLQKIPSKERFLPQKVNDWELLYKIKSKEEFSNMMKLMDKHLFRATYNRLLDNDYQDFYGPMEE